jgi:hypothetical protein
MPDQYAAPADRSSAFLRRLHPVTRLIVAAGLLHLCGDVVGGLHALWLQQNALAVAEQGSIAQLFSDGAHALAYTISFFGTAATVEYLFRIRREVALMRERKQSL